MNNTTTKTNGNRNRDEGLAVTKGVVLLGTVNTMSILGSLGEQALREHGIDQVDPEKWYPHYIRSDMQELPFSQYGEASLINFGWEMIFADGVLSMWNGLLIKNRAVDDSYQMRDMSEFIPLYMKSFTELQSSIIKGKYQGYGGRVKQIKKDQYEVVLSTIAPIRHEAFHRTVFLGQLLRYGGGIFLPKIRFLAEKSDEGPDWSDCVYSLEIERIELNKSSREILLEERFLARTALMTKMFKKSEEHSAKLEGLSGQLGKFVPPQIHEAMVVGNYDTEIATRRKKLTIFFSDIKNFTSTSEGLQPEDLTKYLNEYFSEMTTIALQCGATIDKYIGDAMMVFFGDPDSQGERNDARNCVEMALKMQERMLELQESWRNSGFANPFEIRMGINTGYCNVGNFGSDQRLTYTIIGGEVNVAQRLEANADAGGILMSYESYAHAQDMIEVNELEAIKMKGINRDIKTFSVISRRKQIEGQTSDGVDANSETSQELPHTSSGLTDRVAKLEKDVEKIVDMVSKINENVDGLTKMGGSNN